MKHSLLQIKIEYIKGYPKRNETFKTNPGTFLMKHCDKEARITRINNRTSASNNIMNHSKIMLSYQGEFEFNTVIEIIRNYNVIQEEY